MEQTKLDRINELARKSRVNPLSEIELEEQKRLRNEYIAAYRASLKSSLDNITIVDEKGNKRKPLK